MSAGQVQQATSSAVLDFSFNLWSDPWIDVQRQDGEPARLAIRDCLLEAHQLSGLTDPSPLVVAGLQRLLVAIVQDILKPDRVDRLGSLLQEGHFDPAAIERFGSTYASRFELFSGTTPFLQTADIGLIPTKEDKKKSVGYLFPEEPTATNINHFSHRYDDTFQFSPATAALGLITVPAFATSGGAGIKPSINGVPPLYVLPQGDTLHDTLVLSLVTPAYQPAIRDTDDRPAWNRSPVIERGGEVLRVGYLESLTFPARRVRLVPEHAAGYDSRSGEWSDVLIRSMVFDMGHSRPKDSEAWFDPFAAYRISDKGVTPIRPLEGKTLWREFGNLFHTTSPDGGKATIGSVMSPGIVEQLSELENRGVAGVSRWKFRCIGLRTDMKAKVFEWVDDTMVVPSGLLTNELGQLHVESAIRDVEEWARRLAGIHRTVYSGGRNKHDAERSRMLAMYWVRLAGPFRTLVQQVSSTDDPYEALDRWRKQVLDTGYQALDDATEEAGTRGEALQQRAEALTRYRIARAHKEKEWQAT